jgi:hypothetical protein
MKMTIMAIVVALFPVGASGQDQDKPRVFVAGRGTQNAVTNASVSGNRWFRSGHAETNIDAHDESMEVTKDLQQCSGVVVTVNQANSDYTVMLDRESKQKRGLLRSNSQVQVVNRAGDVVGAGAARTVSHASKDACNTILADWSKHGRIDTQQAQQAISASATQPSATTAVAQTPATSPTAQTLIPTPAPAVKETWQLVSATPEEESLGEVARRNKQHVACLKLAADNPSIVCK